MFRSACLCFPQWQKQKISHYKASIQYSDVQRLSWDSSELIWASVCCQPAADEVWSQSFSFYKYNRCDETLCVCVCFLSGLTSTNETVSYIWNAIPVWICVFLTLRSSRHISLQQILRYMIVNTVIMSVRHFENPSNISFAGVYS